MKLNVFLVALQHEPVVEVSCCFVICTGEVVPPEKVHEKLFVGSQKTFTKPFRPAVSRYNRGHGPEDMKKLAGKLLSKESKLRKRLAEKGIDYSFPGFVSI